MGRTSRVLYLFRELELSFQFGDFRPVLNTSAVPRAFHFFPNKIVQLSGRGNLANGFHQKLNFSANLRYCYSMLSATVRSKQDLIPDGQMGCAINELPATNDFKKIVVVERIFISMSKTFLALLYQHLHTFTGDLLKCFF
jgi:hypothetical protein